MAGDVEKLRQLAGDAIARHREQQQEMAAPEETSLLGEIQEAAGSAMDWASETAGSIAEGISAAASGAAEWASESWAAGTEAMDRYREFMEEGVRLQTAYSPENIKRARETGDYSAMESAVSGVKESALATREAVTNAQRVMASPVTSRLARMVEGTANDPDSVLQEQAQAVRRSDAYLSFFMTPEDRLKKAHEIERLTGIPADSILSDDDTFRAALRVSDFESKVNALTPNREATQELVWEEFPELKELASMDSKAAALALHDIESVRKSKSIVETFQKFWETGNKQLEHDRIGYKLMMGTATEEDKERLKVLQKELEQEGTEAPSFFEDPALAVAAGVAQSGPLMWDGIQEALREGSAMASAAMIAGALAGTTAAGPLGGAAGGAAGGTTAFLYGMGRALMTNAGRRAAASAAFGAGARVGGFKSIYEAESGSGFLEYSDMKGNDGAPLLTKNEARKYAMLRGVAGATLEMGALEMAGRAIVPGSAAERAIGSVVARAVEEQTARRSMINFAAERAGAMVKVAGAEMAEEAAQSVVEDLAHNDIVANSRPSEYTAYTAGDILQRSVVRAAEAAPAAIGFGLLGTGAGAAVRAPGLHRDIRRAAEYRAKYDEQERETLTGVMMVEQLQQVIADSKLKDTSPETQRKILRAQLAGTRYEMAYIDVEMALQGEKGLDNLKEIGKAAGYTTEDIETAAAEHGHLAVPVEVLAQEAAGKELRDMVSFSSDADSIARMEATKKEIRKELNERQKEAVEAQMDAIRNVTETWFPVREGMTHEDHLKAQSEQEMAEAAIYRNIEDPYAGWKELRAEIEAEEMELLAPALAALREGMGKGGQLIEVRNENDGLEHRRISENDLWYREWYKDHKRQPTEAELKELARLVTIGDPSAPKLLSFTPTSEMEAQAMAESASTLNELQKNLQTLDEIKTRMQRLDNMEMELTQGFSPEAYEVYRRIVGDLEEAGGRPARAARISAAIFARHAEIVADVYRKHGKKGYTALDYAKSYQLGNDVDAVRGQQLQQLAWHGTPHDFETFDLGSIGTGEGAQVHGWGLYFAKDREISEQYREKLSIDSNEVNVDGERYFYNQDGDYQNRETGEVVEFGSPLRLAIGYYSVSKGNKKEAIEAIKKDMKEATTENKERLGQKMSDAIDLIKDGEWGYSDLKGGKLLKVDIPDDGVMLNEQEPFMKQPKKVQEAIVKMVRDRGKIGKIEDRIGTKYGKKVKDAVDTILDPKEKYSGEGNDRIFEAFDTLQEADVPERLIDKLDKFRQYLEPFYSNDGRGIYRELMYPKASMIMRSLSPEEASKELNKYGIKGITYTGGTDGRCYVVFDDKAINVIEKYNQLAGIGARTANMEALNKAKEMEDEGKSQKEIWDSTGWLKGRDDKWRFEIPDNLDEIDLSDPEEISTGQLRLGDIYKNPKLYEAYPELKWMYVYGKNMERGTYAAVEVSDGMPASIVFNIDNLFDDKKINENKKSLVHEIQHIIQLKEGFAQGGSEKTRGFIERRISKINKYIDDVKGGREYLEALNKVNEMIFDGNAESKEYKNSVKELEDMAETLGEGMCRKLEHWEEWANEYREIIENKSDFDVYWNLAGEEEARETANRAEQQSVIDRANKTIREAETNIEELAKSLSEEQQKEIRDFIKKKDFDNEDGWEVFDDYPDEIISALADYMQDYENASRSDMPIPHSSSAIVYNGREIALSMERPAASIQGRTSLMSNGTRIVELMETADESTFLHEMGHMFLQDLDGLAEIDEVSRKQREIVNEWAAWEKGAAKEYAGTPWAAEFRQREQDIIDAEAAGDHERADQLKAVWRQERFARGFEMYLKTGEVPARGLRKVFRKFKEFLKLIYHAFTGSGGKASRQVEAVMARMIASEEEIRAMELDDRYKDISKAGGEKLMDETTAETYARWQEEAAEQAKEKLLTILMRDTLDAQQAERKKSIQLERRRMELELRQKEVYLAEAAIKASGDEQIALNWFDTVDDYKRERNTAGSMDEALEKHMTAYAEALDKEAMESHLTDEQITEAMESPTYRKKLIAMEAAIYEEKAEAMRKVSGQAKATIENIIDRIAALDVDTEISEKSEDPAVKELFGEINRLRFSAKWKSADLGRLDAMMKSKNVDELMKSASDFQKKAEPKEEKTGAKDTNKTGWEAYEKANEGMMKAYAEEARRRMAGKKISEACSYGTYRKLERQAAKRSEKMAKAGRWDMAVQQKRQQAQYAALAHEAKKNQEHVKQVTERIRKMAGAKSVKLPKEERYWLRHLAYLLRIMKDDAPMPEGGVGKLSDIAREMEEQLEIDYRLDDLLEETTKEGFAGYQSMTMSGLEGAADAMTALYTKGKDKWNLKTIRGRTISDAVEDIMADWTAYRASLVVRRVVEDDKGGVGYADTLSKIPLIGEKLAQLNQKELSLLLKPEVMLQMLGEKAHRYIYGTYDEAAAREGTMREEAQERLKALLEPYTMKERRQWKDKIVKTYDGGRLTKENIICMALNWGNEVNRQRLAGGLSQDMDIQGILESNMTKRDWELVQGIWDFLNSYWKETCEVEEKLNGVTLQKQKPMAFSIRTADGETVQLEGGYYPIRYNPKKSNAANVQELNKEAMSSAAGSRVLGMGRSHTKARSEFDIVERPLLLEFSVATEHLDNVIHNICWRLAARDVLRLVTDVRLVHHIETTLGRPFAEELRRWAEDCWKIAPATENGADKQLGSLVGRLRGNAVFAIMAYRIWPAIENVSNIAPMMDKLGVVDAVSSIGEFYSNFKGNAGKLNRSSFMRGRINSMDRDLKAQEGLFDVSYTPIEVMKKHAYDLLVYTDLALSAPLWCKAHKNAYGEKLAEVKREVQENIQELQDARAASDELQGELRELQMSIGEIENEIEARKWQRPPGEAERSRLFHNTVTELYEMQTQKKTRLKEVKRELYQAGSRLEMAAELPMWSDEEIIVEADRRAVAEADRAIRDVFGSGQVKDQSSVQRSKNELVKLLTTFYSFFNTQFNAMAEGYYQGKGGRKDGWHYMARWAPFAKSIMYRVVLTAIIGTTLKFALGLSGDDDEKKKVKDENGKEVKVPVPMQEQYGKELSKNLLSTAAGGVPIFRDVMNFAMNEIITGNSYGKNGPEFGSVMTRGMEQTIRGIRMIAKKSEHNLAIEEKRAKAEEKYRKMTPKQKKKWEEDQKYKKKDKPITNAAIARELLGGVTTVTATQTGISGTIMDAFTTSMQYMLDTDDVFDPWGTGKAGIMPNWLWSILFDKRPVERKAPERPPKEAKKG